MKNFKFSVNRNGGCGMSTGKEANTPPCCFERASRRLDMLRSMLSLLVCSDEGRNRVRVEYVPSTSRLRVCKQIIPILIAFTLGVGQMWGALTNSYTKVTSVTDLADGDVVVLATESSSLPSVGVSGQNGTNDAAVSTTESEWVQYEITLVKSGQTITGWTLYNPTLEKYVQSPTGNHFKHGTTGGTCSVKTSSGGQYTFTCNSRYLQKNGNYYRMYGSINNDYTPFYVWKVASSCSVDPTVGNIMNNVSGITASGATFTTSSGVSAGSNCTLSEVGFVYGTSSNPTITTGTKATIANYSSGNLSKSVTGLNDNTTYYVRAFATNGHGTTYSDQKSFTTLELAKYTVQFSTGEGNPTRNDLTEASAGAGITLPTAVVPHCSGDGWSFAGWKETSAVSSETTTAPTLLAAGSTYHPTSNCTLYAVYKKTGDKVTTKTINLVANDGTYDTDHLTFSALDGTLTLTQIKGTTNTAVNSTYSKKGTDTNRPRVYKGQSLKIESTNYAITKVEITANSTSYGNDITAATSINNDGSVTDDTDAITKTMDYTSGGTHSFAVEDEDGVYGVYIQNTAATTNTQLHLKSVVVSYLEAAIYYLSAPNCCESLAQINGSVSETQPEDYDKKTVEWTIPVDGSSQKKAAGVILKLYADNNNAKGTEIITKKADYSNNNNTTSHTFEGLDPETKYWFTVTLIGGTASGVTYCDSEEGEAVSFTTDAAVNTWAITYNANADNVTNMPTETFADRTSGEGTLSSTVPVRAGYTFLGWDKVDDASVATYAAGAAITDVDDDLDLYAIWERRDVTLVVGSGSVTSSTLVPDGEGKVLLPSAIPSEACAALNWQFIGWAEAEAIGTKPATIIPAGEYTPAAKKTLYAVYSELGNTYTKITSGTDFTTGNYVFAILSGKALNNTISTKTTAGTDVTISDNSITDPDAAAIWLVTKSGDNYTLYNAATEGDNKYLNIIADGKYGQLASESTSANYTAEFTNSGDILLKSATISGQLIEYYGPSSIFQCWGSANTAIYAFKQDYSSYETVPNCVTYTLSSEVDTDNTDETSSVSIVKSVLKEAEETTATATPKDGYRFLHWTISGTGAAMSHTADGKSTDNPVTVTMGTANATITAYFEKIPSHKVYFYNGTTPLNGEGTDVLEGGDVAYNGETPESCDDESTTFAGWTTEKWTGKVAKSDITENTFYEGALPVMGENDVTYYAVFCKNNDASALFSWAGGVKADLIPANTEGPVTANGLGSDYAESNAPYRVKFDTDGDYIIIETSDVIASVTVGVKMLGGANATSIKVQESTSKTGTFTDVETLSISGSQNDVLNLITTQAFAFTSRAIKLIFQKGNSGSNVGVGPITIMGVASASNYMTTCLLDLGAIDGTVGLEKLTSGDNAGKLQASWTMESKDGLAANGIIIKIYKDGENPTLVHTSAPLSKDAESYVWATAPDYCSEYYATLTPVKVDNTYKDGVEQGKSASNCAVGGQYTYHVTLNGMQLKSGETEEADNCSDFSAIYETTGTNVLNLTEVSVTNVQNGGYTWNDATGALTIDKTQVTGNVEISLTGNVPSEPIVSVAPSSWDFGTPQINGAVEAKDFVITSSNLTNALSVVMPNAAFAYTIKSGSLTPDENGDVSATITVTPSTASVGDKGGNIVVSGVDLGESVVNVAVSLNVQQVYTVNWYVNNTTTPVHSQTAVAGTDFDEVPDDFSAFTDCSDFTFVGWKEGSIDGGSTTTEPSLAAIGSTIPEANKNYYAVFASGTPASIATIFSESLESGISTTGWTFNNKCYTLNNAVRISTGDDPGVMTSPAITSLTGTATLSFEVKAWSGSENGKIDISASKGTFTTTSFTTSSSDNFEEVSTTLTGGDNTTTITFTGTKSKRISIRNVKVTQEVAPVYTKWYTTCPHITSVTLSAGSADHGSISFEQGGEAVTSVRTDGSSAVEVDVVASLDEGYELTGLTLTSEDVTGADKNEALTKITIPAGEEGTLTVTPTITLIPKYSITFANGGADGGTAPSIAPQYAGETITLPANTYTYTDHKFDKWKVTYGETELIKATGETFPMPTADVTITAQWIEYVTCSVKAYVNGTLVNTLEVESEHALALSEFGTPTDISDYTFAGWALSEEEDDVTSLDMLDASITPEAGVLSINIYAVFSRVEVGENVTDVLTAADLAATGTSYVEFSDVQKLSSAKYAGRTAKNGSGQIQINDKSNSGIYSSVSAGKLVSVAIEMSSAGKKLGVYGSNDGFTGYASIPSQSGVTKIEDFVSVTTKTITPSDDYTYVAITSAEDGAKYITSISITWQPKTTYYTTAPGALRSVEYSLGTAPAGAWKDGEGCANTQVKSGLTYTICEDEPFRDGFKFDGWTVDGGTVTDNTISVADNDITITAKWLAKVTSNLTYSDGAETPATVVVENVEEGTEVTMPTVGTGEGEINLSKSGYNFKGWKYNGTMYKVGETFIMPAEAATLVAQWKKQDVEKMTLVTSMDQLVNGSKVVIAYNDDDSNKDCVAADISGKYLSTTAANFADNAVTYAEASAVEFTLEIAEGGWKLRKDANNYLTTTAGGDLSWTTAENASVWVISVSATRTTITSNTKYLQYNYNNGTDPRMKGYAGTMGDVLLYTKMTNVTSNESLSNIGYSEGDVIVVDNNSTLTIDDDVTPINVTVKSGSTVVVNTGKSIDATSVVVEKGATLEINGSVETDEPIILYTTLGKGTGTGNGSGNDPGSSSQIINANNLTANDDVYLEIELTQESAASAGWYAFSVPFPVDAMNGVYYGDTKLTNEVGYAIMSHYGELRAKDEYAWKKFRGIMQPGVFYVITVGNTDYKTLRFKKVADEALVASSSVAVSPFPSQTGSDTDGAWNGIGNPNLAISNLSTPVPVMQFYDHKTNTFIGRNHSVNLVVGSAFFIQYSAASTVSIPVGINAGNGYLAPRREGKAVEEMIYEVQLTNVATDELEDNIFLSAREEAMNEYEIGHDVAKMSMGTAKCAQMWVPAYGTKLCAADFPLVNNKVTYPLTITAPQAGTYSISTEENDAATIYLTKDGHIIWNLSMSPCEIELPQGTTEGYGLVLRAKAPSTATGVENTEVSEQNSDVQKVIIDEHVYILRGGEMYDVTGKMVR